MACLHSYSVAEDADSDLVLADGLAAAAVAYTAAVGLAAEVV